MSNDPDAGELLQPTIVSYGPAAKHNMPCAVCRDRPAVLNMNEGTMGPCWHCQGFGWKLIPPMQGIKGVLVRWLTKEDAPMTDRSPNIPSHAVTAIVAFALGVAVGAIAVLEGWA